MVEKEVPPYIQEKIDADRAMQMMPQPTDPKSLADLSVEDRVLVLTWMKNAIHSAVERYLTQKTLIHFTECHNSGGTQVFNVNNVWDNLPFNTQWHFEHSRAAIAHIDAEIAAASGV